MCDKCIIYILGSIFLVMIVWFGVATIIEVFRQRKMRKWLRDKKGE